MAKIVPLVNLISLIICWTLGLIILLFDGMSKPVICDFLLGLVNIPFIIWRRKNLKWIVGK